MRRHTTRGEARENDVEQHGRARIAGSAFADDLNEITFDYAMRNYSVDYFAARCRCGSRRCRGRITGWRDLPAQRKADYHGFAAPYLIEIDRRDSRG
ncbi:hypothetical protein AB4212_39045 [Streptomyces sp. 2MCAF27]